jgi:hypothetical protein
MLEAPVPEGHSRRIELAWNVTVIVEALRVLERENFDGQACMSVHTCGLPELALTM